MITDKQIADAVVHLTMEGVGAPTIAKRLGITPNQVYGIRKREIPLPPTHISRLYRKPSRYDRKTPEEIEQMVDLHKEGFPPDEIAKRIGGTTTSTVRYHLLQQGFAVPVSARRWRFTEYDYLLEHVNQSWDETARILGRSRQQVKHRYAMLRRMGFDVPSRKGRQHAQTTP